ncbi:hypothetical protein TNIN_347531 [Trichonephila inaurata madagascariensis]|uniref:C2H2-type domain-containing protein n=1 Tax=Trichonephila inaurata madagascariensis TaxID=2747483 RepID=A0A8X7CQS3_9ARAC|nr:hypothetical protein TNIN_347531 [Trichonephila inaurata madagascariensis]
MKKICENVSLVLISLDAVERQGQEKISSAISDIYSEKVEGNLSYAFVHIEQELELGARKKKAFQCNVCSKYYAYKSLLQRHLVVHTGEKPYPCHFCDNSFKYQGVLYNHLRTQHSTYIQHLDLQ